MVTDPSLYILQDPLLKGQVSDGFPLFVLFSKTNYVQTIICLVVCLFVCLFVCWNKTRKTILCLLCWEGSKSPGSDRTRAEAQTTCVPKTAVHTMYLSILYNCRVHVYAVPVFLKI